MSTTQQYFITFVHNLKQRFVEAQPKRGDSSAYVIVVVLMGVALLVRLAMAPVDAGLQYVTFFPAVTLSVVIGGFWPGIFATFIGLSLATFFSPRLITHFPAQPCRRVSGRTWCSCWMGSSCAHPSRVCIAIAPSYAAELKEAKHQEARVAAINKSLDEFTHIAAHDLKEPLRGIHNYASILRENCAAQLGESGRQHIDSIQRLAERLSTLIGSLMVYSRLGVSELAKDTVDVDTVVDAVAEDLSRLWTKEGIELRRKGSLGTVQGDATRIGEVFQNLFSNAAKYNDKPSKWIEVGCDRSGAPPVFYVRDNGIGIPQHHHENIFRIFKRLHEQNRIERHGGRIWLESVPGEGATFHFTFSENT